MLDWFDVFEFLWRFGPEVDAPGDVWLVLAIILILAGIVLGIWVNPWWFMLCLPGAWIIILFLKHKYDQWRE